MCGGVALLSLALLAVASGDDGGAAAGGATQSAPTAPLPRRSAYPSRFGAGAHEAWIERVRAAGDAEHDRVLAEIERHLAAHPDDEIAVVERCRFLDALADEEQEESYAESEACRARLKASAHGAEAALFLVETSFGDDAAADAEKLLPAAAAWTRDQQARLYAELARLVQRTDAQRAADDALAAVELDPRLVIPRLQAARRLSTIGAPDRARALLTGAPDDAWTPSTASQAASILVSLRDPEDAVRLLRAHQAPRATADGDGDGDSDGDDDDDDGDGLIDAAGIAMAPHEALAFANALADAGDVDTARKLLAPLVKDDGSFLHRRAVRAAFALERAHGDAAGAAAAYERLRDEGFRADPLLRLRFALLAAAPRAPWHLRDGLGLAALLGLVALLALLPLLVVAPIHYRGLVLRARAARLDDDVVQKLGGGWQLRHALWALGAIAVASGLAQYMHDYNDLVGALGAADASDVIPDADERGLARMLIVQTLLSLLLLAPLLRGRALRELFLGDGDWSRGRAVGVAVASAVVLRVVCVVWNKVWERAFATGDVLGADITRGLTGIYVHYGALPLIVVASLAVPLVEELVFRGAALEGFARHVRFRTAMLVQAALFGLIHEDTGLFLFYVLFGCTAAMLRKKSGGLLAPVILHGLFNLTACLGVMAVSRAANG